MKRTLCTLGVATLVLMVLMVAVRPRTFGSMGAEEMGAEEKKASEVKIDNFVFSPNPITVGVGSTVHWTNRDDIPHNVVSEDKSFKSKVMDTDEGFAYTFTQPGTYNYFCSIHPKMTGKIVVQ